MKAITRQFADIAEGLGVDLAEDVSSTDSCFGSRRSV
jgi:hypothetical protein